MACKDKELQGNERPYYGFPFISPINRNIQTELYTRSRERIRPNTPFIKVTPGVTINGYRPILRGIEDPYTDSNPPSFTFKDRYRPESSYRPLAGITKLTIDHKNKFGSVREATLEWQCHTIEDLERLQYFFMHPGRTLLIEWGWSSIAKDVGLEEEITEEMGLNFGNYYNEYGYKKVYETYGNYDIFMGIMSDYNWSYGRDGSISCTTKVYSGGIIIEGIDMLHQSKPDLNTPKADPNDTESKVDVFQSLRDHITTGTFRADVKAWSTGGQMTAGDEEDAYIFTPKVTTEDNKQNKVQTNNIYVSWGFIEDFLLKNLRIVNNDNNELWVFNSRCIKITNHKNLRSTDFEVCIIPNKNTGTIDDGSAMPDDNPLLSFNNDESETAEEMTYGYIRNILINVNIIESVMESSSTFMDFISKLFGYINNVCANIWDFQIRQLETVYIDDTALTDLEDDEQSIDAGSKKDDGKLKEHKSSSEVANNALIRYCVVDTSFVDNKMKEEGKKPFEFKYKAFPVQYKENDVKTAVGMVRDMNISSDMSKEQMLNILYGAHKGDNISWGHIKDNSVSSFYSNEKDKDIKDIYATEPFKTDPSFGASPPSNDKKDEENNKNKPLTSDQQDNLAEILKSTYSSYPLSLKIYSPVPAYGYEFKLDTITQDEYLDKEMSAQEFMKLGLRELGDKDALNQAVIGIKSEIILDGLSGIRIGDVFQVDYLPKKYKERGFFQINNVKHVIDKGSWVTTLSALYRVHTTEQDVQSEFKEPQYLGSPTVYGSAKIKPARIVPNAEKDAINARLEAIWKNDTIFGFTVDDMIIDDAKRIIQAESSYDKDAQNLVGADRSYGLFQINMISTHEGGRYELLGEKTGQDAIGNRTPHLYKSEFALAGIPFLSKAPYNLDQIDVNIKTAKFLFKMAGYSWKYWTTRRVTQVPQSLIKKHITEI